MIEHLRRRFPALAQVPRPAWAVGGAVRDLLLGRDPADVDVICGDAEACARALSDRPFRLGRGRYDAWRVEAGGHVYDFTTHHGSSVEEDLARRDFTVNAIAVDLESGAIIDPFGGRSDIERRIVRMIRPENFDDDPLRTLKGVRMAVTLDFAIDPATLEAMRARAPRITSVAAERVAYEMAAIVSARRFRRAVELLHEARLDEPLFSRAIDPAAFHADDVGEIAAWALLAGDPKSFARRWRLSRHVERAICRVRQLAGAVERGDAPAIAVYDAGDEIARLTADYLRAQGKVAQAAALQSLAAGELFSIRPLLSGDEIAAIAGLEPGPGLGRRKRALLEAQIAGKVTTRDEAVEFIRAASG